MPTGSSLPTFPRTTDRRADPQRPRQCAPSVAIDTGRNRPPGPALRVHDFRRGLHSARKVACVLMLTPRTGEDFHLMFRDDQTHDGEIMDLPTFFDLPHHRSQCAMARLAMTGAMDHHPVRCLHPLKGVSCVTCLPSFCFAARWTFFPLAFEAITRRRLATVVTIFCQSSL